jgi:hypothetical protein
VLTNGIPVKVHIENDIRPCPCVTPEGFRDPLWHLANPDAPECNNAGYITGGTDYIVNGFILPAASRGQINYITEMFGEIRTGDRIGVLPVSAGNYTFDFSTWDSAGENFIYAQGNQYQVVGYTLIPSPDNTNIPHHWELALRLQNPVRPY